MDSSLLSRILSGERLFTYKQLMCFTDVLHVRGKNKEKLVMSFFQDVQDRYGVDLGTSYYDRKLTKLMEWCAEYVIDTQGKGTPGYYYDKTQHLLDFIEQNMSSDKATEVYGRLLAGHFHNLHNLFKNQEAIRQVNRAAGKMENLYQITGRENYQFQAMAQRAFAAGHGGNNKLVLRYLKDVRVTNLPVVWRLTIYAFRYPALFNLGIINGEAGIPQEVFKDIDSMSLGLQVAWYEALALAYARQNNISRADKILTLARSKLGQIVNREEDYYYERLIQLARAEAAITSKNPEFRDRDYLVRISHQAQKTAHERGFYRFEEEIRELKIQVLQGS